MIWYKKTEILAWNKKLAKKTLKKVLIKPGAPRKQAFPLNEFLAIGGDKT